MKRFLIVSLPRLSLGTCFALLTSPWTTEPAYTLKYTGEPPGFAEEPGEPFAQGEPSANPLRTARDLPVTGITKSHRISQALLLL